MKNNFQNKYRSDKKFLYLPKYIENVIKKGGGNRPSEALATLYHKEGATFYHWRDNRIPAHSWHIFNLKFYRIGNITQFFYYRF